ncbi:MAG: hypothetical protein QME52_14135, partial [Bacteroidota bacterium]|nr:hypothetical protein [Bacteroidota bacterium]
MKTKIISIGICLITFTSLIFSQTITRQTASGLAHPLWVVGQGGGKSTADTFALHASIGQPIIQMMTADTFILESGFIPGLRMGSGSYTTHEYLFAEGWNMVSIPLLVSDYRKSILFPTATSPAFGYLNSYEIRDTLRNSEGYWLKFPSEQS